MRPIIQSLVVVTLFLVCAFPAAGGQQTPLSEEEMERRLAFISERLNEGRTTARYWQYGWSSFYAASAAVQGVKAIEPNDGDDDVYYTVGAVKSAAALALMLLKPLPAVEGATYLHDMPTATPEQKEARFKAAEDRLHNNARRAEARTSWTRHLTVVAVNLIGSAVIAVFGDGEDAVVSGLTGIALGEANIWSQPSRAIDDLADYEKEFPAPQAANDMDWELTPIDKGLCVTFRF